MEEIHLNCHDPGGLSPGSSAATKLSRFFDKVIERQVSGPGRKTSNTLSGVASGDKARDRRQEKSPLYLTPHSVFPNSQIKDHMS